MRLRHLILLLAIPLFAAACGDTADKNAYVDSINKAQATLQRSLNSLGEVGAASADGKQVAARLEAGGKAIEAAAGDFDKISPPSDAAKAHAKMIDGLHKFAGAFHRAAAAARSNDTGKLLKMLQRIDRSPGAKEIQQAEAELKANGYKFAS